jgi:hypothetical protein
VGAFNFQDILDYVTCQETDGTLLYVGLNRDSLIALGEDSTKVVHSLPPQEEGEYLNKMYFNYLT